MSSMDDSARDENLLSALRAVGSRGHPTREGIVRAIKAGCTAADIHLMCSYPDCNCKQMPKAIEAAIKAYATAA